MIQNTNIKYSNILPDSYLKLCPFFKILLLKNLPINAILIRIIKIYLPSLRLLSISVLNLCLNILKNIGEYCVFIRSDPANAIPPIPKLLCMMEA